MIDWITKLPDAALGAIAVGAAWFGFNYAVLGERLMERELTTSTVPACVQQLAANERSKVVPRSGIGTLLGVPELDVFEDRILESVTPAALTAIEREARCLCAVTASSTENRFDYALHTATFRMFPVDELASLRGDVVATAASSDCSEGYVS